MPCAPMHNVEISTAAAKQLGRIKRADAKAYGQTIKAIVGLAEQRITDTEPAIPR